MELNRKELEEDAEALGLRVTKSMSRAELITKIEQQYALQEFGEIKAFSEHRFLIVGLFFVTLATFILALLTYFDLNGQPLTPILAPIYIVFRGLGGFLIAAALFSLGLKTEYRSVTPIMRAAFIIGAVLIVLIVIVLIPLPNQWVPLS